MPGQRRPINPDRERSSLGPFPPTSMPIPAWLGNPIEQNEHERKLKQAKLLLQAQENPLFCAACEKTHTRFGMEIEIDGLGITNKTYPQDFIYDANHYENASEHLQYLRMTTIRNLEGGKDVDESKSDFGIDGSGASFELRNINADTPAELAEIASYQLSRFFKECERVAKFHKFTPKFSTRVCGIHVHRYHRGINRQNIISSHAIVGSILNYYSPDDWLSRLNRGYGDFFSHRTDTSKTWCRGVDQGTSTELRQFNAVHIDTFRYCLETQEKIIETSKKIIPKEWFMYNLLPELTEANKDRRRFSPRHSPISPKNEEMTLYIPVFIAWAIKHRAVQFEIIRELVYFLNSEYRPLVGEPEPDRKLDFNEIEKNLEIFSRNETPEILPYTWYCEQIDCIRQIGRGGQWWLDNMDETGKKTPATDFSEYEKHMKTCKVCEITLKIISDNGNKIVTDTAFNRQNGISYIYATLKPVKQGLS